MSFSVHDKTIGIYGAKMYPFRYIVKCRPYLTQFMLELLPKYQVFFYTAGIRVYGEMIIKIMKSHILDSMKLDGQEKEIMKQIIE